MKSAEPSCIHSVDSSNVHFVEPQTVCFESVIQLNSVNADGQSAVPVILIAQHVTETADNEPESISTDDIDVAQEKAISMEHSGVV